MGPGAVTGTRAAGREPGPVGVVGTVRRNRLAGSGPGLGVGDLGVRGAEGGVKAAGQGRAGPVGIQGGCRAREANGGLLGEPGQGHLAHEPRMQPVQGPFGPGLDLLLLGGRVEAQSRSRVPGLGAGVKFVTTMKNTK